MKDAHKWSFMADAEYPWSPNNRVGGTKTLKINKGVGVFMQCQIRRFGGTNSEKINKRAAQSSKYILYVLKCHK